MSNFVINDEQPIRGTLIDVIQVIHDYINQPKNTLIGTKTGTIVTADDVFPNIPKGAKVFGKSVQDGTPTPDAPVEIVSVDDLTLWFAGKNLCPTADGSTIASQWTSDGQNYLLHTGIYGNGNTFTISCNMSTVPTTTGTNNRLYVLAAGETSEFCDLNTAGNKSATITVNGELLIRINKTAINSYGVDSRLKNIQLELGSTATAYEPYVGQSVQVLDTPLRSLPDGTEDTLTLSYVGPSEREGWGVYSRELVQRCAGKTFDGTDMTDWRVEGTPNPYWRYIWTTSGADANAYTVLTNNNSRCTAGILVIIGQGSTNLNLGYGNTNFTMRFRFRTTAGETVTVDELSEYFTEHPTTFVVPMQQPVTTTLDPIELPVLPAPNLTFFASGGNAQPDVQISYERDITIVIDKLEAAETPVGSLSISPVINHTFEPAIEPAILQEETEWQSDSI